MTIISTSTGAFFERARQDMRSLRAQAENIQGQLGRGERLSRSSDNPVAASRLRSLSRANQLTEIDTANANRAKADLTLADAALSSIANAVIRVRELALRAGSDVLDPSQRAGIAAEIEQIHGTLVALANARDSSGHALFGGEASGPAYELDGAGNAVYIGTASSGELPLGDGQTVTRGLTGPEFLSFNQSGTPTDIMAVVKALSAALQGGVTDPAAAARDALGTLDTALDSVTTGQTLVGTRLTWIDITTQRHTDLTELRSAEEAEVGGVDPATAIVELQEVMLALEASQASFSRLSSLNLFAQLR